MGPIEGSAEVGAFLAIALGRISPASLTPA